MSWADDYAAVGARYLDEHEPGWAERIDLITLEMVSPCGCILGQLGGDYRDELRERGWNGSHAAALGFTVPVDPRVDISTPVAVDNAWAELDVAWIAQIRARRETAQVTA